MKQIAAEVGVSVPAVSEALHGTGGNTRISQEVRARIIQAAAQIGYRPNSMARGTRTGRTQSIALVLASNPERSHLPAVVHDAVCESLGQKRMHLVLSRMSDEDFTSESTMPRILNELVVDGLLVNYTHGSPQRLSELIVRYRIPAIWLNHKRENDCVYPDDAGAGRMATEHLLALGHRRIAMVDFLHEDGADRAQWHYSVEDRFAGYAAAMRAAGGAACRALRKGPETATSRLDCAREWLARADRPTAVITYHPEDAIMLAYLAAQRGIEVPRDLSLVSFSEQAEAALGVPMTIAGIPAVAMGETGVERLMQKIRAPTVASRPVCVPYTRVCGATTAPPA